jgi:hypothetical protein
MKKNAIYNVLQGWTTIGWKLKKTFFHKIWNYGWFSWVIEVKKLVTSVTQLIKTGGIYSY